MDWLKKASLKERDSTCVGVGLTVLQHIVYECAEQNHTVQMSV